ncbi:MAG TPA: DNA-3-methyladenine glycosylase [Actinomycetota bacterium]|nr:DNA-3-methyladenine glycosylase [Actinomycetota bacterium]
MRRLSPKFFGRPTLEVAASLVGYTLYRDSADGLVSGRLVEVEAYCGPADPNSHAFRRTPRSSIMYGPPGILYVYLTYGMHHCSNIVCEADGTAGAVLMRAVEPLEGLDLMAARRELADPKLLAKGPGRLCQAFGLNRTDNGTDLAAGDVWVGTERRLEGPVLSSYRIGVDASTDFPWRFYEPGPWTSGPKKPPVPPRPELDAPIG